MIIITGAAGFIGSSLISKLNNKGFKDLILVDDFSNAEKNKNLQNKAFAEKIDREVFLEKFKKGMDKIDFVFHIGARTDTAEFDKAVFNKLNLNYSKAIWKSCSEFKIPLIYASSAATYGMGEHGFVDDEQIIPQLKPLNPYGESKNEFDKWVLQQNNCPPYWAGFKFFNVYGPNEYHKNRMASVVFHCFKQIQESGEMKLFRSHHKDFKDGEQLRDFIYVKDLVSVLFHFMLHGSKNGIYNLGTGKARSFKDLAENCFKVMGKEEKIHFIDTPKDIRDKYQYFTEAKMDKLRKAGYTKDFYSLEAGIKDYVGEYLMYQKYY
jgi:ADP-L-glycero-D-manno-heptose 6-epimerase